MTHRIATTATLSDALRASDVLLELLDPVCERVEIAGSVRRRREDVKDIEVVAVADTRSVKQNGLFGFEAEVDRLERLCSFAAAGEIETLRRAEPAAKPNGEKPRRFAWGEKYKRLIVLSRERWFCVDLFITTAPQWGAQFAIRTGPAEFSKVLVTSREQGGAMPPRHRQHDGFLQRLRSADDWQNIDTLEEQDYFDALGVPCWEPRLRSERLLREHLGQRSPRFATPYSPYSSGASWS